MIRSIVALLAVLFAASAPLGARAQDAPPPPSLQTLLDTRVAGMPDAGIVLGVIDHGKQTIYVAGQSGTARPLDHQTTFEIGSDTKTFTATILASMALDGEVKLSDPVASLLPASVRTPSKDGRAITLLDLAEQRSGLPRMPTNMSDVAGDDPYAGYTDANLYAFLSGYTLTRAPGEKYEYSNLGIGLLGTALADRAGTTYAALLAKRVLEPLGMSATTVATMPPIDSATLAAGHDLGGNPVSAWHFVSIAPAGGVRSNIDDMLKYLRCNMGEGSLSKACLFAQQPRADGEPKHEIGLVWWTNPRTGVISHGGDTAGFHAFVAVSGDRQTGVVALSNGPIVSDIASHALVPSVPVAACPVEVASGFVDSTSYVGVYCIRSMPLGLRVAPGADTDTLMIAVDGQASLAYRKIAADTYQAVTVGASARFLRQAGAIVGFDFLQNGTTLRAVRLGTGGTPVVDKLPAQFVLDAATLAQYAGSYHNPAIDFTVTMRGRTLLVRLTGQPATPVYASTKDEFFYNIVDAQITFNRDASGNVSGLTLHQNGHDLVAARSNPR